MGFPLLKLIVCLLLVGPLASPGWGHARVESPARGSAHLLEEWQGVMEENPAKGSFDLKVRYTYGQNLVKQDRVTSPAAADTSDYYGYDGLGSVRVLIQGSGQAWAFGHKYLYCNANPVNMVDPSGHAGETGVGGMLAGITIRGYIIGTTVSYIVGKGLDAIIQLAVLQDLSLVDVEIWERTDWLNLIPGALI